MSQWGWVTLAYVVTFGSLGVYAWSIAYRLRTTRRRLRELE